MVVMVVNKCIAAVIGPIVLLQMNVMRRKDV